MKPDFYKLEITLHEAAFFASHELHDHYFTEPLIGNYALAYALGLVNSPYNRYHVGYSEDLPLLNDKGIYVTPAWPVKNPQFRIERFNCQSENFFGAMTNNAVVEIAGRQFIRRQGNFLIEGRSSKKIRPTNRPQTGIIKLLCPQNRFACHLIAREKPRIPRYIRVGKFMSKAKIDVTPLDLRMIEDTRAQYPLINSLDLSPDSCVFFGDTINIHPSPLTKKADIQGPWWADADKKPVIPANLLFRGL
ncbi:type I-D CRISPR-associated protein Cas5/Csc1 [Desulfococcaceae bacterium HSG7]|nr:type I-D CRISPR-associated protein Cas5/Csc1 [Desulfococcaceae bacterium HSG7]